MTISCSYLSSNDKERVINELNKTNVDYIHLDIMDGKFTENETLDFNTLRNYFYENTKKLDVHLMVKDVKLYTELYSLLNPEYITFHLEIGNTKELINYVKNKNIKVGLAINPNTDINEIKPFINDIDLILVMSVYPGKGGQKFLSSTIPRLNELMNYKNKYNFEIYLDGGINNKVIKDVNFVDGIVSGSYICQSKDYEKQIKSLRN